MGGNAFKNTKRLTEKDYRKVCAEISEIFDKLSLCYGFPVEVGDTAELASNLGHQEPYGDVDVVVGFDGVHEQVVDTLQRQIGEQAELGVPHSEIQVELN